MSADSVKPACWSCGTVTDDATGVTGPNRYAAPALGDVSVCLYCGSLALYIGDGYFTRQPTAAERSVLMADPDVERVVAAVLTRLATL